MATRQLDEIGAKSVACYPLRAIVPEHPIFTTYHESGRHRVELGQ
jgi:hypothetical protein